MRPAGGPLGDEGEEFHDARSVSIALDLPN
jgi:hypothetical protein